ncbi:hypothetical protein [Oceanibacterium hippocampi]|uniref:Uncharacterized protein n=1 Tax=Oceanibacterium hippocampi TaxID=745714 RepID=A0A1Y5TXR2_9PROT|nr:hypothetical protein [Oceanibacterium hippocampi]SLN76387.1 hypothetical protein OCH7691_04116 [Oceanibacterium hippocampi]
MHTERHTAIDTDALADVRALLEEEASYLFTYSTDPDEREPWERCQRAIATIDRILNGTAAHAPVEAWAVKKAGDPVEVRNIRPTEEAAEAALYQARTGGGIYFGDDDGCSVVPVKITEVAKES